MAMAILSGLKASSRMLSTGAPIRLDRRTRRSPQEKSREAFPARAG